MDLFSNRLALLSANEGNSLGFIHYLFSDMIMYLTGWGLILIRSYLMGKPEFGGRRVRDLNIEFGDPGEKENRRRAVDFSAERGSIVCWECVFRVAIMVNLGLVMRHILKYVCNVKTVREHIRVA